MENLKTPLLSVCKECTNTKCQCRKCRGKTEIPCEGCFFDENKVECEGFTDEPIRSYMR